MKHLKYSALLAVAVVLTTVSATGQTNVAATNSVAAAADREQATIEKHSKPILAALKLDDAAKEAKVRATLAGWFQALHAWHATNDAQIKTLWGEFDQARARKERTAQDVADANAALDKIAGVYATFKPQHDKFLADLSTVLTPAQVEAVKDAITIGKVKFTYDVYLQIFPTLTDAQKAVVLADLKQAREESIDCENMKEISAIFKKYKIKIEDEYLTAQGYNPQQARKDFAAKQKEKNAPKKTDE